LQGSIALAFPAARSIVRKHRSKTQELASVWPKVDLWTLRRLLLPRVVPVAGTRPSSLNELLPMTAAACRLRPSVAFDWGTYIGSSARVFYECGKAFKLGYEIHSIDLPPDESHVEHPGQDHGRLVQGVDLHRGNGVEVARDLRRNLGCPKRPLFFVDGDCARESVRDELDQIFSTVPDANALAHDTFFRSAESNYNAASARAIDEIVRKFPRRFHLTKSGLVPPGMTLLAAT
jgi:hypothetical protein